MMRNGNAYRLRPLVRRISASASSFLPTPRVMPGNFSRVNGKVYETSLQSMARRGLLHLWPTPTANLKDMDTMERARYSRTALRAMKDAGAPYQTQTTGMLNPTWVEWLMGFPREWTALPD
jgi:hypothetical protein